MKISVIFPVRNESNKLLKNLQEKVLPYFDATGLTYDVLICYDYSSPEQCAILEEGVKSLPAHVKLLPYENKRGKGFAVKKAILASDADYDLFMDADLATDLSIFSQIQPDLGKIDAFVASRDVKGAKYVQKQSFVRRITHWGARTKIRMQFGMKEVHDTQCGYKCIRHCLAKEIAKRQIVELFAFDVEYCYFLHLNGYSIKECAATWCDDGESTVGNPIKSSIAFSKDCKRIKKNKKNYILTQEEKEALC